MTVIQPTLTPAPAPGHAAWRARAARTDWDKTLTDAGIYLLALGGFYVGYQTLYTMALIVHIPTDQAIVLAALADIAILLYSRKAVQEVNEGRSAWGIRLIVSGFSLATFTLQLRAAWPDPLATGYHALAPAVWIIGHEMMLRGRLRTAKAARRAQQIEDGLRPATLPAIRLSWWVLDPYHTVIVWRLMHLWEQPADTVIRHLADERRDKDKHIPRAWQGYLTHDTDTDDTQTTEPGTPRLKNKLVRMSDHHTPVPDDEVTLFLRSLPPAPPKGRPKDKAIAYIKEVEDCAARYDIWATGRLMAELMDVSPGFISRLTHP